MNKKLENAIIIGGRVYELIDDLDGDECDRCAFADNCDWHKPHCVEVFGGGQQQRFIERTDL